MRSPVRTREIFLLLLLLGLANNAVAERVDRREALERIVGAYPALEFSLETQLGMPREAYRKGEAIWASTATDSDLSISGVILDSHGELLVLTPSANSEELPPSRSNSRSYRLVGPEDWEDGLPLGRADIYLFETSPDDEIATTLRSASPGGAAIVSPQEADDILGSLARLSSESAGTRKAHHAEVFLIQPHAVAKSRAIGSKRANAGPPILTEAEILRILGPKSRGVRRSKLDLQIHFAFDSAALDSTSRRQLEEIAKAIANTSLQAYAFEINGHTDARGAADYNQTLSVRRAESVRSYLVENSSVEAGRLRADGFGAARILDPRDVEDAHAVNRRVEFKLVRP